MINEPLSVPPSTRHSVIFIDESQTPSTTGGIFTLAGIKIKDPDLLTNRLHAIRSTTEHTSCYYEREFKFNTVTKASLPIYQRAIDELVKSRAQVGVLVIDRGTTNFFSDKHPWEQHMRSSAFLVKRLAARDELLTICSDTISTPMEISYGNSLQRKINNDFECLRIATAVSLNSRTNDILQLADLIAGAVRYSRTHKNSGNTLKNNLSSYIAKAYGVHDFCDCRKQQLLVRTYTP